MAEEQNIRPRIGPLRLHNFALAVGDLPAMIGWYQRVLGLCVTESGRFEGVGADYAMLEGGGVRLELISAPGAPQRPADRTAAPDHLGLLGWKALVLESEDLPATNAALAAQGVEIVWANRALSPERHATMIRDPEGNLIRIFDTLRGTQALSP